MTAAMPQTAGKMHEALTRSTSEPRAPLGRALTWAASLGLAALVLWQVLYSAGVITAGFDNWRPVLYGFLLWAAAIGAAQVLIRGERGKHALFVLPAVAFTVAMVIFPTFFGLYLAFMNWNLSSLSGPQFNGLDNLRALFGDAY